MRKLPKSLPDEGLLVGWSLEPGWRRPVFGFRTHAKSDPSPSATLEPILDTSEGHLITIAPTGAGKGTGCIIPALLRYPGPVIVVDPKGENAAVTARRRRELGQEVIVFDPFEVAPVAHRHRFNPLDLAHPSSPRFVEDVQTIAHLAATNAGDRAKQQDPFWPQMGRTLVTGAILDVLTMQDNTAATLPAARGIINQSIEAVAARAQQWASADHPELRRMAGLMHHGADTTMAGYWAMAVNHLDFAKGAQVENHLSASDLDLNAIHAGAPLTLYLVLPPDKLESHAPLLRLWIGALMSVITRRSERPELPTLFLIDEAAQLGELRELRQAITLLRGYGVRVWTFWQDLSQLKGLYPDTWETILNNCRVQQYFGATTGMAADAVVETSGYGPRDAVLELERGEMILNCAGDEPVVVRAPNYRFDPPFQGLYEQNPFYAGGEEDDSAEHRPLFRRTEAPKAAHKRKSLRQAMTLAQGLFHPVPRKEWVLIEGEERKMCMEQAGLGEAGLIEETGVTLRRCMLPFYADYDWYELTDTRHSPERRAYFLLMTGKGKEGTAHILSGSSDPVHEVNAKSPPQLTESNVHRYLDYFCSTVMGEEGRFLILDSADEIEWREPPDESVLEALRSAIAPPRFEGRDKDGNFKLTANLVYATSVFTAQFQVETGGMVHMLDDDPLFTDLDIVPDVARLNYVGVYTSKGTFMPLREKGDESSTDLSSSGDD